MDILTEAQVRLWIEEAVKKRVAPRKEPRLERIATACLPALMVGEGAVARKASADLAIKYAKALIAALDKEAGK